MTTTRTRPPERWILGAAIAAMRQERGLSQAIAARKCGISQPLLSCIERGEVDLSWDVIEKLLTGFGIEVSELFYQLSHHLNTTAKAWRDEYD